MNHQRIAVVTLFWLGLATSAGAQQSPDKLSPGGQIAIGSMAQTAMPRESLEEVLSAVADREGLQFVVDARVPAEVVVGQVRVRDLNYPVLLTVLANNGLAAITIEKVISIVPVNVVRQYALPLLTEADNTVADMEWVTWVVQLKNVPAKETVPIVRPLLPQAGHLAANPTSNSILIVDRYANVQRVTKILQQLDAAAEPN